MMDQSFFRKLVLVVVGVFVVVYGWLYFSGGLLDVPDPLPEVFLSSAEVELLRQSLPDQDSQVIQVETKSQNLSEIEIHKIIANQQQGEYDISTENAPYYSDTYDEVLGLTQKKTDFNSAVSDSSDTSLVGVVIRVDPTTTQFLITLDTGQKVVVDASEAEMLISDGLMHFSALAVGDLVEVEYIVIEQGSKAVVATSIIVVGVYRLQVLNGTL